jgi:hypothetical protein
MENYQVNVTYNYGEVYAWISLWCADGYVGRLIDNVAMDDCKETNWCVFAGTQEECEQWIKENDPKKYI